MAASSVVYPASSIRTAGSGKESNASRTACRTSWLGMSSTCLARLMRAEVETVSRAGISSSRRLRKALLFKVRPSRSRSPTGMAMASGRALLAARACRTRMSGCWRRCSHKASRLAGDMRCSERSPSSSSIQCARRRNMKTSSASMMSSACLSVRFLMKSMPSTKARRTSRSPDAQRRSLCSVSRAHPSSNSMARDGIWSSSRAETRSGSRPVVPGLWPDRAKGHGRWGIPGRFHADADTSCRSPWLRSWAGACLDVRRQAVFVPLCRGGAASR